MNAYFSDRFCFGIFLFIYFVWSLVSIIFVFFFFSSMIYFRRIISQVYKDAIFDKCFPQFYFYISFNFIDLSRFIKEGEIERKWETTVCTIQISWMQSARYKRHIRITYMYTFPLPENYDKNFRQSLFVCMCARVIFFLSINDITIAQAVH